MGLANAFGIMWKSITWLVVLFAIAVTVLPKVLLQDLPADLTFDFTKPTTIIVTGSNSGLGLATVQHFSQSRMAKIIMGCRSMDRCEKAKQRILNNLGPDKVKATLSPMQLDLASKLSVENFAKELLNQPIHVLINNAGLAGATAELAFHEEDGVENHVRVNHLGHVYLAHCLWKNLRLAEKARIVVVSSVMAAPATNVPTKGWYKGEETISHAWNIKMYGRSKRANLFWASELHQRYANDPNSKGISVVAAHPGFTHTELCKNGCKGQNKIGRYFSNLDLITGTIKMSAEDGALSQCYAAVIPRGGFYIGPSLAIVGEPKILGTLSSSWHHLSFTRDESKYLWDKSLEAMGIKVFGDYEVSLEDETEDFESKEPSDPKTSTKSSSIPDEDETEFESKHTSNPDSDDEDEAFGIYLGEGKYHQAGIM